MIKPVTTDEFIAKARAVHGNKYDYSKVEYVNNYTKVCIVCPDHGEFWKKPRDHSAVGQTCPKCARMFVSKQKRYNTEYFVEKAIEIHGDKYDYSKVLYKYNNVKVCIICPEHGEFWQKPNSHISGKKGCLLCGRESTRHSNFVTFDDFVERAKRVHGERYEYEKSTYSGYNKKMIVVCKKHGSFFQVPHDHLRGRNCIKCRGDDTKKSKLSTTKEFVDKSLIIHGNKYDYSKVDYINAVEKVIIICQVHRDFKQTPNDHLNGCGCPGCWVSKGELAVEKWLVLNKIRYIPKHGYPDLVGMCNVPLHFDFYLPDKNILIEYDGQHHFRPVKFHGMLLDEAVKNFERGKRRDAMKDEYCAKNNIPLLRIPYTDFKRIPDILSKNIPIK